MTNTDAFSPKVQVSDDHYEFQYDEQRRWSSYWWQLKYTVQNARGGRILEIGIGNGLASNYLRAVVGASVTTVDIAESLNPDVVADIASLPFENDSFDCVVACEVLEHTPYDHAEKALAELKRVARSAVISVPDARHFVFQLHISLGSRQFRLANIDFSRFLPKTSTLPAGGEHYWEIGREDIDQDAFESSIREAGWKISEEFRNPNFIYHHFYILER